MLSRLVFLVLVVLAGAGLTLQMVWNARLRVSAGSPVLTTIVSVVVTLVSLSAVWASGATPRGALPAFGSIPLWAWCGGILGGFYLVASLLAIPRLGAAAVFSLVIAGQLVTALVIDGTGAFGVAQIAFTVKRALGVALVLAGAMLLQKW